MGQFATSCFIDNLGLGCANYRWVLASNLSNVVVLVLDMVFHELLSLRHLNNFKVTRCAWTHVLGKDLTERVLANILVVNAIVNYVDVVVDCLMTALVIDIYFMSLLWNKYAAIWQYVCCLRLFPVGRELILVKWRARSHDIRFCSLLGIFNIQVMCALALCGLRRSSMSIVATCNRSNYLNVVRLLRFYLRPASSSSR